MDLSQIGREIGPDEIRWTPDTCILYALGAGASELAFRIENTGGVSQRALLPEGRALATLRVAGIRDKRAGALVERGVFTFAKSQG
jgi:hypothetical protein